jgi:hypothetical protein
MATFLAERYWPGVTPAAAGLETARLRGAGVRILETIVADRDEVCFWYVEAGSPAEVGAAFAAADVVVDRIGPARRVAEGPRAEPSRPVRQTPTR